MRLQVVCAVKVVSVKEISEIWIRDRENEYRGYLWPHSRTGDSLFRFVVMAFTLDSC
jgi:hypothetical protein